jgi:predicted HAD superfamily Cof-like phosphohydrolase
MLRSYESMVRDFHLKFGHLTNNSPTVDLPESVIKLRKSLIKEEVLETLTGIDSNDISEIADGIADAMYVLVGTAISYGIPIDRVFREVHRSNMTKTAVKAVDGEKYGTKTPKGPNFIPPDIKGILEHPEKYTKLEMTGK